MANITNVRTVATPQKAYMWEVQILGLAGATGGVLQDLATYAKSVSIPQSAVETIVINHKATRTAHAGRDSAGHTVSLTFWDDEAGTIHKYLNGWMQWIMNADDGTSVPRNLYSAQMKILLKDSKDSAVTQTITLSNIFPTEVGDISLNYDGSDAIEISATFNFDKKIVD